MPQAAIYRYYPPTRLRLNTYSSFLTLPRAVRERIYFMASLGPNRLIDLNYWTQHRWCPSSNSPEEPNPHVDVHLWGLRKYEEQNPPSPLPVSLLLVCKVVSQEAQDMLYGTNCFAISQRDPGGLRGLERLSRRAIRNLRTLLIHITPCTCLAPHCTKTLRRLPHIAESFNELAFRGCFASPSKRLHDRRLSNTSRTDRRILKQWERVCHRLAEHIVPDQLTLYIVCHVESRPVAEQIIRPLLQLPGLRNCGICLGPSIHTSYRELQALAATAVQRLTARTLPALQKPFPFLHLPRELQLQILAASPLVQGTCVRISEGRFSTANLSHCCEDDRITISGEPIIPLRGFCKNTCAAFRTGCSNATCATYLTQLSCIGKASAEVANDVFFSQNAFSIHTWRTNVAWDDEGNVTGIHSFLARLPSKALARIRRLDILLPPIGDASFANRQLGWTSSWQASMQLLATKATLPSLALTIKIGNYQSKHQRLARKEHFTAKDEIQMLQAYNEVVYALVQLHGLKLLFLYVPCPFGRGNEEARVQIERRLEQVVMGAGYNADLMGKPPPDEYTRPFLFDEWQ
jgi:hypothetical protein